jgi:hypothetical protein
MGSTSNRKNRGHPIVEADLSASLGDYFFTRLDIKKHPAFYRLRLWQLQTFSPILSQSGLKTYSPHCAGYMLLILYGQLLAAILK